MTEFLSVLVTLGILSLFAVYKPEWLMKPLLNFLTKHLPESANRISNTLGVELIRTGAYAIGFHSDNAEITAKVSEIISKNNELEKLIEKEEK